MDERRCVRRLRAVRSRRRREPPSSGADEALGACRWCAAGSGECAGGAIREGAAGERRARARPVARRRCRVITRPTLTPRRPRTRPRRLQDAERGQRRCLVGERFDVAPGGSRHRRRRARTRQPARRAACDRCPTFVGDVAVHAAPPRDACRASWRRRGPSSRARRDPLRAVGGVTRLKPRELAPARSDEARAETRRELDPSRSAMLPRRAIRKRRTPDRRDRDPRGVRCRHRVRHRRAIQQHAASPLDSGGRRTRAGRCARSGGTATACAAITRAPAP